MVTINGYLIYYPHIQEAEGTIEITCGYCESKVSSLVLAFIRDTNRPAVYSWVMCTNCSQGSIVDFNGDVIPNIKFGKKINNLPLDIEKAYEEARNCYSASAYTGSVLLCRKIIMHVAVDKGAEEGDTFVSYLTYLEENHFITSNMKIWIDHIRNEGNTTNHTLSISDPKTSESILRFTSRLLDLVYEAEAESNEFTNNVQS